MRIIKHGALPTPPKPWWVGTLVNCPLCKGQIQLEEGDDESDDVNMLELTDARSGAQSITLTCPTKGCNTELKSKRIIYRNDTNP